MSAQKWLEQIEQASKDEAGWRKDGADVVKRYKDEDKKARFNILWPNVEIMRPSLYSNTPIVDVRQRYKDADPIGKSVAEMLGRALTYTIDAYDFDSVIESAVLDYLLPGRGLSRVDYRAYDQNGQPVTKDGVKAYEAVTCRHVPWQSLRLGPATNWRDVPWIAFEHRMTRAELVAAYPEFGDKVPLDESITTDDSKKKEIEYTRGKVWEIWDKDSRKVIHIAPSFVESILRVDDDPLNLEGFWPVPKPLYAIQTTESLVPVEEYRLYKKQAEEIDLLSARIMKLIAGMRLRGIYNSVIKEFDRLMAAGDNDMIPAETAQALMATGQGLDKAVAWMPIEQAAKVLQALYQQREQAKAAIFEITGLSDILRGATDPNETLGAQQLKAQTGSLRMQRRQREVQRYVRDVLRIKAEIIAEHFAPETLQLISGMEVTPEMLQVLRNDRLRGMRVDIETDSTISADQQSEREAVTELIQGIGGYVQNIAPAVQGGAISLDASKKILKAAVRRFKFGREVEDAMDEEVEDPMAAQQAQMAEQQRMEQQQAAEQEMQARAQAMEQEAMQRVEVERKAAENALKEQLAAAKQQATDAALAQREKALELEAREKALALKEQSFALKEQALTFRDTEFGIKEQSHGLKVREDGLSLKEQADSLREQLQGKASEEIDGDEKQWRDGMAEVMAGIHKALESYGADMEASEKQEAASTLKALQSALKGMEQKLNGVESSQSRRIDAVAAYFSGPRTPERLQSTLEAMKRAH